MIFVRYSFDAPSLINTLLQEYFLVYPSKNFQSARSDIVPVPFEARGLFVKVTSVEARGHGLLGILMTRTLLYFAHGLIDPGAVAPRYRR
jgi:hypothetical protein